MFTMSLRQKSKLNKLIRLQVSGWLLCFNTSRPKQNGHHFPDDIKEINFGEWKCMNFD